MRVLHFRKKFSVLSETFIYDYITGLERQGVTNHVATLARHNAHSRPFENVHIVRVPRRLHPARLAHYVLRPLRKDRVEGSSWPLVRRRLRRLTERLSPDLIHAHCGPDAVLISPVARQLHVPLVVTFYGSDISRLPRHEAWRTTYGELWRHVAAVTVLSNEMRQDAIRLGCPPERVRVVHIGRDLAGVPSRTVPYPVRHFITVGRLVDKKGHVDTIRAFSRVAVARPELRLTLVGDGPLRSQLERLVVELRMEGRVSLVGSRSASDTLELMREADAFILCSKMAEDGDKEGTPTVLLEAQFLGLPCVATRHSGIPETIPTENHHLLAAEGDVAEIAERLSWLVAGPRAALEDVVLRGRHFMLEHFDPRTQTANLRLVYASVAKTPPACHG